MAYFDLQHHETSPQWQSERPPHPADLVNHFASIKDIVEDKDGTVKILAKAMDMSYADCANLLIDQFTTIKGVLRHNVEIMVDGQPVTLKHPHTGNQLTYGDVLTDRSGPKFGGYLQHGPGNEFLTLTEEEKLTRKTAQQQQIEAAKQVAAELGVLDSPKLEQMIAAAAAIFNHPHPTQRRLSDFDLEMADFNLLCQSIGQTIGPACEAKSGKPLSRELLFEVALTHWLYGGDINTDIVAQAAKGGQYTTLVKAEMERDPESVQPHWLVTGPGAVIKTMLEEAELTEENSASSVKSTFKFGPAVGYYCREVKEENGKLVPSDKMDELSDVILDSGLDFEPTLTKGLLDQRMLQRLKDEFEVTQEQINSALEQQQGKSFDFLQLTKDIAPPLARVESLRADYHQENSFRESSMLMQEIAHKLALSEYQSQLGQIGKLEGNIADTAPLLDNLQKQVEAGIQHAAAQQQLVMLSYLVTIPKWGIEQSNLQEVGKFQQKCTDIGFGTSLTERSYKPSEHTETTPSAREAIGWTGMDKDKAAQYLKNFANGSKPVFDFAKEQGLYFEALQEFSQAYTAYKQAPAADAAIPGSTAAYDRAADAFLDAHANLHGTILDILQSDKMAALRQSLEMSGTDGQSKLDELAQGLTAKSVQTIAFNERCEALAKDLGASKEKEKTAVEVMETSNPMHALNKLFAKGIKGEDASVVSTALPTFPVLPKVNSETRHL